MMPHIEETMADISLKEADTMSEILHEVEDETLKDRVPALSKHKRRLPQRKLRLLFMVLMALSMAVLLLMSAIRVKEVQSISASAADHAGVAAERLKLLTAIPPQLRDLVHINNNLKLVLTQDVPTLRVNQLLTICLEMVPETIRKWVQLHRTHSPWHRLMEAFRHQHQDLCPDLPLGTPLHQEA